MSSTHTVPLERLDSVKDGVQNLVDELEDWLEAVIDQHTAVPWQGIHDEATFVTAWAPYYALTQDKRVPELARLLRDRWLEWAETNLVHGYHPRQEAHHGPEHYIIFLDWLSRLDPEDATTRTALLDAAHHIGNWIETTPAWYDWTNRRFLSNYLGTAETGSEGLNIIEHLRFVHLALTAYEISQEQRYLDFAVGYAGEWATEIMRHEQAPLYLDPDTQAQAGYEAVLNSYLGAAPKDFSTISRLENHVANGTPQLFFKLWQLTNEDLFGDAADKLVVPLLTELADPYANPAGYLFSLYRRVFDDEVLDDEIIIQIGPAPRVRGESMQLGIDPEPSHGRLRGLGKRNDMPNWFLVEADIEEPLWWPSPTALALAYEVSRDETYALTALSLALSKLQLARQVYPDGRHHGCTARSIAAVCRGHGRCWGIGDVSGVLTNPAIVAAYGSRFEALIGIPTN